MHNIYAYVALYVHIRTPSFYASLGQCSCWLNTAMLQLSSSVGVFSRRREKQGMICQRRGGILGVTFSS